MQLGWILLVALATALFVVALLAAMLFLALRRRNSQRKNEQQQEMRSPKIPGFSRDVDHENRGIVRPI